MDQDSREWIPFEDAPWSSEQQILFQFILKWSRALKKISVEEKDPDILKKMFADEAVSVEEHLTGNLIPQSLVDELKLHADQADLPLAWFASQIKGSYRYYSPVSFASGKELKDFLADTVVAQGKLVAKLIDVAHRWQIPQVTDLATAFFLVRKLVNLKDELAEGRLFIPLADLEQAGVSMEDLKLGNNNPQMQKMLWKQIVRVRDAFAQGQPLVKEVPRKFRRTFKRNWLTGLELIGEVEKRNYDIWTAPIELTKTQNFQITVLSFIGKGAAKARG